MPIKVCDIELTEGLRPIRVDDRYSDVRALIRYRTRPLGWVEIPVHNCVVSAERLRESIFNEPSLNVVAAVFGDNFPRPTPVDQPPISVIVCTRNRAASLRGCIESLLQLDYSMYEIIVVDNATDDNSTACVAAQFPVRYIREPRPGLDWARNRGVEAARHNIVAYTDDDACPDPHWLRSVAEAFSNPEVMAVTGPVLPIELETSAQLEFEMNYGGMSHGFRRRFIRATEITAKELLQASSFGVGANMAFRRDLLQKLRGFDPALDVGTPSGGGGDIELFHRLVTGGHTLLYEPTAIVRHKHRRDIMAFRRQLFCNGTGFACYLFTCARNRTVKRRVIAHFFLRHWLWSWLIKRTLKRGKLPRRYVIVELRGALVSPIHYWRSQNRARQLSQESNNQSIQGRDTETKSLKPARMTHFHANEHNND